MEELANKPTHIYNPDLEDFTFKRCGDDNIQKEYTLEGMKISILPRWLAIQGAEDLMNFLINKKGIRTNYEQERSELLNEILMKND